MYRHLISIVIILACATIGWSSQVIGHMYTALAMRKQLPPETRTLVAQHLDVYLLGANAPDVLDTIQRGADTGRAPSLDTNAHEDSTGALTRQLLASARTPAEKVFALGWATHYLTDVEVQHLINRFGGRDSQDPQWQYTLDQLENKIVFSERGKELRDVRWGSVRFDPLPDQLGGFVFDAYHATYPEHALYDPTDKFASGATEQAASISRREYFNYRFAEAASQCAVAANSFYRAHRDGSGAHNLNASYVYAMMPTDAQYREIIRGKNLQVSTKPRAGALRVEVSVKDTLLFGLYRFEWLKATDQLIPASKPSLTAAAKLMGAPPAQQDPYLAEVTRLFPDRDLSNPQAYDLFPGKVNANRFNYELAITTNPGSSEQQTITKTGEMKFEALSGNSGFAGSRRAAVKPFDIPIGAESYAYTLTVSLLKAPIVADVDYVRVRGQRRTPAKQKSKDTPDEAPEMIWALQDTAVLKTPLDDPAVAGHVMMMTEHEFAVSYTTTSADAAGQVLARVLWDAPSAVLQPGERVANLIRLTLNVEQPRAEVMPGVYVEWRLGQAERSEDAPRATDWRRRPTALALQNGETSIKRSQAFTQTLTMPTGNKAGERVTLEMHIYAGAPGDSVVRYTYELQPKKGASGERPPSIGGDATAN